MKWIRLNDCTQSVAVHILYNCMLSLSGPAECGWRWIETALYKYIIMILNLFYDQLNIQLMVFVLCICRVFQINRLISHCLSVTQFTILNYIPMLFDAEITAISQPMVKARAANLFDAIRLLSPLRHNIMYRKPKPFRFGCLHPFILAIIVRDYTHCVHYAYTNIYTNPSLIHLSVIL